MEINIKTDIFEDARWNLAVKKAQSKIKAPSEDILASNSPVLTGRLQKGWSVKGYKGGISIRNNVGYTIFQEEGTKYIEPKYMAKKSLPSILNIYEDQILEEIDNID